MPKQRITKEMVIEVAFELARQSGMEGVLVKNISEKLGCSVQPIYSYCSNMDSLKQDLVERTATYFKEYIAKHIDPENYFKSVGAAYVSLAKEEPYLFKLYFLRKQQDIYSFDELYAKEGNPNVAVKVSESLHISIDAAKELHKNMLIYTMGISSILATSGSDIPVEEISDLMENAYQAFFSQIKERIQN